MTLLVLLLGVVASANEPKEGASTEPLVTFEGGGHVKAFFVASFPYESELLPNDPSASTSLDIRLTSKLTAGIFSLEVHPDLTATAGNSQSAFGTGVGNSAPEAIPMTVDLTSGDELTTTLRFDRAVFVVEPTGAKVSIGRQPITFGTAKLFTPLDLIAPFNPTTIDSEYKPGVDAVRVDAFFGMATEITLLGAYLGDWHIDETAIALHARTTLGVVDAAVLAGTLYGEPMFGFSTYIPVGPVGAYADASGFVTDDGFEWRGVVGADVRPTATTTITAEIYGQSFGANDLSDVFALYNTPRYQRGELWLAGRAYVGLAVMQEITPLWGASLFAIVNLTDPSAMVNGSLSWSAAENADLVIGVMAGVGERPDGFELKSELGLLPISGFVQTKLYF